MKSYLEFCTPAYSHHDARIKFNRTSVVRLIIVYWIYIHINKNIVIQHLRYILPLTACQSNNIGLQDESADSRSLWRQWAEFVYGSHYLLLINNQLAFPLIYLYIEGATLAPIVRSCTRQMETNNNSLQYVTDHKVYSHEYNHLSSCLHCISLCRE